MISTNSDSGPLEIGTVNLSSLSLRDVVIDLTLYEDLGLESVVRLLTDKDPNDIRMYRNTFLQRLLVNTINGFGLKVTSISIDFRTHSKTNRKFVAGISYIRGTSMVFVIDR